MRWLLALLLLCDMAGALAAQPLQRGSYRKMVAAHAGKPFIVALWSVSCPHCSADLEMFRKLLHKYPAFNLVLVSTDTPEEMGEIDAILDKYRLSSTAQGKRTGTVESWVFADSYGERLRFEIDPQWYGELPRTYFFDAGGRARGISGVLDEAGTEQWVRAAP